MELPNEIVYNGQVIYYLNNSKPDIHMDRIDTVMQLLEIDPCEIEILTSSIKPELLSRLLNLNKLLEHNYEIEKE